MSCNSEDTSESTLSLIEQELMAIDDKDGILGRNDCLKIYRYWWFGKRIVEALSRFAFSEERIIDSDEIPDIAKKEFIKVSRKKKQDLYIKKTITNARIYGMAVMAVLHKDISLSENLKHSDMGIDKWRFVTYDPLVLGSVIINQNPSDYDFLKAREIRIPGATLAPNRGTMLLNGDPQYLSYTNSTYSYSGVSVFNNMIPLIRGTINGVVALRRIAAKASSVILKSGDGGKFNKIIQTAAQKSLELVRALTNTGAVKIDKSDSVDFFPLTGVNEVDSILKMMNEQILIALDDTPASILLDRAMSTGFTEGNPDYKATVMAVNSFRELMIDPLYEFSDPFIMNCAWTDSFVQSVINSDQKKYAGLGPSAVRNIWMENFSFKYGTLFPQTEKETEEKNGLILDNLQKASALGADVAGIEDEVKNRKIFQSDFSFNQPQQPDLYNMNDINISSPRDDL